MNINGDVKHPIITSIFIVIILLFVCSIFTGNSHSNSSNNSNNSSSELELYSINDTVNFQNWEIKIKDIKNTKTLNNSFDTKTTNNNYVIVTMDIKNLQNEPAMLLTSETKATDSTIGIYSRSPFELKNKEAKYVANYELENYVKNDIAIMFSEINPNITVTYTAIFETDKATDNEQYIFTLNNSKKGIKLY